MAKPNRFTLNPLDPRLHLGHDCITVSLADGRTWTLRYGRTRERSERSSFSDLPRYNTPDTTLVTTIDNARLECHHVYIDGSKAPLYDHHRQSADPIGGILQGAAWLLLANVMQRHNQPPVLRYSDYRTLLSIHPSYPEPPPAVLPLDEEHAVLISGLPPGKPPLIVNHNQMSSTYGHRRRNVRVRPRTIESEIVENLMERLLSSWPAGNW